MDDCMLFYVSRHVFGYPHWSAIACAIPGKVLLLSLALSAFGNFHASAYQAGIVLLLLNLILLGGSIILVCLSLGSPLSHKQVFFQKHPRIAMD